jgi:hypothetical protein
VHDFFDIVGVARNARPTDIRRACCGWVRASHPDVWDGDAPPRSSRAVRGRADQLTLHDLSDAAVDFVDASTLVDRMQASFFAACASTSTR